MIGTLHIDDLDGAVTLFKYTDEGTETIAVFDEEHREVIQDLLAEIKRLREEVEQMRVLKIVKENERLRERVATLESLMEYMADEEKVIE
tara:strand:- start:2092 stop:2361 length:270 start_codon:yes stop_codon:yes gene_type:complete